MRARAAVLGALTLGAVGRAIARAGGGGHGGGGHSSAHFSGGHSFGHVGSGGGSSNGVVALIIIVLIIYFIYRRATRAGAMQSAAGQAAGAALGAALATTAARRGGAPWPSAPELDMRGAVDRIRARDPAFEMETFLQRAEMIFFLVKRGIQRNEPVTIRPYLGDAVFTAVASGISQAAARHQHALLESLNVRAVHAESATCDDSGQRIRVHFDLVYRGKMLNDAGQVVADEGSDRQHGECWTFSRGASATTPQNGGVVAARCPGCGAELRLNLDGTCAHCRASVTSGELDWVVSEVKGAPFIGYGPGSALAVAAPSIEEGVAQLCATDPSFSMEAFKVRAKAAFRALQEAWSSQNLDAGRAFLSPGAYFAWRAQLETLASEGRRNVLENLTVLRIDPVQIVHGRVFDDLTVRISASAADFEIDKDNRIVFGDRTVRSFTEDWTFQRSVGVTTPQKAGTLENTCPGCGAPISLNQIGECRYCRAAVTSGKFDWVVSRIEQEQEWSGGGQGPGDARRDIAMQAGAVIVGGLLSSLISNRGSNDWN